MTTTTLTAWKVNSGGDVTECNYIHNMPITRTCGSFTLSQTDVNGEPNNSSLSVVSVDSGLSGITVTCSNGNGVPFGSRDICVLGKTECHNGISRI